MKIKKTFHHEINEKNLRIRGVFLKFKRRVVDQR